MVMQVLFCTASYFITELCKEAGIFGLKRVPVRFNMLSTLENLFKLARERKENQLMVLIQINYY